MSQDARWTAEKANAWWSRRPWLVGSNYLPATAANSLEMWQVETFDPETIDRELGWAAAIGMNSHRVFLHHLLWEADAVGFADRVRRVLDMAERHGATIMPCLFDSCFDPEPHLGRQTITPGVSNSAWVQGPGRDRLEDEAGYALLEDYVRGIVSALADDPRVAVWDVWNEPTPIEGPPGLMPYRDSERKTELTDALLERVFGWVRAEAPTQPMTSALFLSREESDPDRHRPWTFDEFSRTEAIQIANSDIVSFHCYDDPDGFARRVAELAAFDRPLLCTEWLLRPVSTVAGVLPLAREARVGMYNWGFVTGRSQTRFPWDSWLEPYVDRHPDPWMHDLLHEDGTPYRTAEIERIRELTAAVRDPE
jgi:hypothetical protein